MKVLAKNKFNIFSNLEITKTYFESKKTQPFFGAGGLFSLKDNIWLFKLA